ncbi:diguanylate cyclase/phosphodiesterase [Marinobacter lipolyticus SM19]|uniref:Diguanylate cyclase/phosphodiesterase n=1 Tax=Marinobacter lipolyticus SM19 TaxID=1318628 RepID=R8AZ70_9GAMM|nr:GGDEF domain-containing response regulator [Marinobacter lipolyticus]EON91619.1 diguanylate cyclase/phosphodiesterase [Marinobacter lipolyticus SM19]
MSTNNEFNVVVIEDDNADFIILESLLQASQRFRFKLTHVKSFQQAQQFLTEASHDIFLLDYFLGADTAIDFLKEASLLHIPQPVVVLTGADSGRIDDEVINLGAADFIPKNELSTSLLERTIHHAVEHKRAEINLERLAKRDPLTGLGNRLLFEEMLEASLARAERKKGKLAVLFLDLDRFKEINDSLGHPTGDLLLTLIADRIRKVIRNSDFAARIGGDEFTILVDEIHAYEDAVLVANKLLEAIAPPTAIRGHELNISASIGIALYPENGKTPIKLMQKADIALYEAKRHGINRLQCFTARLQTQLEKSIRLEKGLRRALEHNECELYLQPKWNLCDQKIIGFEALLRWLEDEGGVKRFISPTEFIPVAEKTGLIIPLGEWVIYQACKLLKAWEAQGISHYPIAINVSPLQLKSGNFGASLKAILDEEGIPAHLLEIELTEETLVDIYSEDDNALEELEQIRSTGARISIDDFGTGYSSLKYLKHFPSDYLKIDKSFVSVEGMDSLAEPAICRAIVTMAESLGMQVIAEGIETDKQLQALTAIKCSMGQGYLIAKPMPAEQALLFAQNHNGMEREQPVPSPSAGENDSQ